MISASEARQKSDALGKERDEKQKVRIEKAINDTINDCGNVCQLEFIPTEGVIRWLKKLGYKVNYQIGGRFFISW